NFQCLNISEVRCLRTVKHRLTRPRSWWAIPKSSSKDTGISKTNQEFLERVSKDTFSSPVKCEAIQPKPWTPNSMRCGLIARKIGVYPLWLKTGQKVLCTLLQVNDNHVIRSYTSKEYARKCIYQNRWRSQGCGALVVGAESSDPQLFTAAYCGLFTEAGVAPKKKLTTMLVTDDALLPVGTPLSVNHFRPGHYVDCYGLSKERGFQGVRKRWGFKGLPKRNNTKAENRPGSISIGRKKAGPHKGTKMAGHMGSERCGVRGLKIFRINTKHNVLFVQGHGVPGATGAWVYVYDCRIDKKRPKLSDPPPFPTYIPEESSSKDIPENIYSPEIHAFTDPTVIFVETEEEKKAARVGAKIAKVRSKK
ncbi:60S ribosomal protein L3-like protein, partial [Leptotrombidium deliense]